MEILNVLAAALAAFVFGAIWYIGLSKPWIAAAGIVLGPDGRPANTGGASPFIIGLIAMVIAAGMMRHIFGMTGIAGLSKGISAGLGIGAFSVMPWVAMNYAFGQRPMRLTMIDGGNVIIGSGIMGAVLTLF
jgi:hypothetical protein